MTLSLSFQAWLNTSTSAFTVLLYEDTLKVDFGVHVNGRIVDSAFTLNFEPTYDNLLLACREATETGVKVRFWSPNFLAAIVICAKTDLDCLFVIFDRKLELM